MAASGPFAQGAGETGGDQGPATREQLELSASGEAYLRAVGRRVDTQVGYYDPTRAVPPLDTDQEPETADATDPDGTARRSQADWPTILVTMLLIAGVAFLFFRFGGRIPVSLRPQLTDAERARQPAGDLPQTDITKGATTLRAILGMGDPEAAIVALMQTALTQVVRANGLLLQKSWTARDVLRRLPGTQPHMDALRALVLEAERVHFGGRRITREDLDGHIERVRPLLSEARA